MLRTLPLLLAAVVTTSGCERECSFVSRDISPDGRFEIELCRVRGYATRMPGQSSDAPGKVILRERPSGRALRATTLEMVQLMDDVTWSQERVHIKLIADWPLPPAH